MGQLMVPRIFLIGVLAAAALFGVYGDFPSSVRALLALPYLLAVPGLAWLSGSAGNLNPMDQAIVSVALTLAMETVLGTLLLMCGQWSTRLAFGMLLAATIAGLACTWTNRRSARREPVD